MVMFFEVNAIWGPTNLIAGLIWSEIKQLWDTGARAYISDMWNVADFVTNSLYLATIALRTRAYYDVSITTIIWVSLDKMEK